VSLPGVPPEVGKAATAAGNAARESLPPPADDVSVAPGGRDSNVTLTVKAGTTDLVRIARGYLNRIITPFESPKLLSVNPVEVQTEGSSLYLATSSDRPVGIHILSNDPADTRSISLTLIPAKIPPKTVTLLWPEGEAGGPLPISNGKAQRWEESAPYEEKLYELVQLVARGQIPDGYALSPTPQTLPCTLPDVQYFTGQQLVGSHFSVFVLRATNNSHSTLEILSHGGCNFPGVALVAPWPRAYLEPGASTEVYVAVVNATFQPRERPQLRPSLLSSFTGAAR
jgi:conjugal transfer pilus assembly protein TraK